MADNRTIKNRNTQAAHPVSPMSFPPFQPRTFWEGIDPTKRLYSRFAYLNGNFKNALNHLCRNASPQPSNTRDSLKWIFSNGERPRPGRSAEDEFYSARRTLAKFSRMSFEAKQEERKLDENDLAQFGLDENTYLITLQQVSEFVKWAYGLLIPERIKQMYSKAIIEPNKVPMSELEALGLDDLAVNPTRRFPAIIIIDDSLSMGGVKKELEDELSVLFDEIDASPSLSGSIELYIATCGGKDRPTEIVSFATIDRQASVLDRIELLGLGRCFMASAINMALDRLDERLIMLRKGGVEYYCPWLIILSDGKFNEDMTSVAERLNRMKENHDIMVYPIGVSQRANLENLGLLDQEEAAVLTSIRGFFRDVFNSIKRSENSITAGEHIRLLHQEGFLRNT